MNHINTKFRQLSVPAAVLASLARPFFWRWRWRLVFFSFLILHNPSGIIPKPPWIFRRAASWNGEALALLPDNPSVSFDNLSLPVRSVTVVTAGSAKVLSGNVGICDAATSSKTTGAGSFTVNPGGRENTFTVRLHSHGDLNRLPP